MPGAYAISKLGTSPCKSACPAHISIQGFIALIAQGKYKEGLELIKQEHPFPAACGRVCHHPCEEACTRAKLDKPLAIEYLKRFLADLDLNEETRYIPEIKEKREEKIAIIGSGPAGLTAAYYLAWQGYQVTVYEKLSVKGGMMRVGIPEYRLPRDILEAEIKVIEDMGVVIKTGVTFGLDITLESLKNEGYKAVYLATGLHLSRNLNIDGEDLPGVLKGVDFLRDSALGMEISLGKKVVVVGGGNVAIDVALTAKRLGAEDVKLVCLETRSEMPAWDYEIEEALEEGIEIINSLGPQRFIEKGGNVGTAEFKKCISVFDGACQFNPSYDESDITVIDTDNVIVAIGQMGDLSYAEGQDIPVTKRGGIEADPVTYQTQLEWVFAGGDIFYGPRSVVEAVECAKEAVISIDRYINGLDITKDRDHDLKAVEIDPSGEPEKPRVKMSALPVAERKNNFNEIALGFTEEDAKKEAERCLSCGLCSECYQCVDACLAGAIDHQDKEAEEVIEVGSVVLCHGAKPFDPSQFEDFYSYKSHPNVMTSLEFERILSASGPTMGHMVRPSDKKEPKKIAWLQCIGSRDTAHCGNGYCSSVCCMYAIKDAVIAKEHAEEPLDAAIFYMDIRTFGKDYEKYLNRAKDEHGVRFVRSRVHTIDPIPGSDDLRIRYSDEKGDICYEDFDMVILSVGLEIMPESVELSKRLGIDLNKYSFASTEPFAPVSTSRRGIYTSGIFQGPKDIPASVTEASAAALAAGLELKDARGTQQKTFVVPDELDVMAEEPRIGVFVCNCGINIGAVVDVPAVTDYAATLPNVVFADNNLFTCSQDTQDKIKDVIKEKKLNRIVVASCSPRTHEPLFQETLQSCGLNKYLFEMANIRDQDSWVHAYDHAKATDKAKDLVRMAVARAGLLRSLNEKRIIVNKRALVVGGGIAGINVSLGLADQGFEVVLLEKNSELGGFARNLTSTIEGNDIQEYLKGIIEKALNHQKIKIITNAEVVGHSGFQGNFMTEVKTGDSSDINQIEHGVIIIATGASEYKPNEYSYDENKLIMTQVELSSLIKDKGLADIKNVVMIQCVGSRDENNPNCSRICCQGAIKNAIHIKEENPDTNVYIINRDIRTYGFLEDYYTRARELGVIFIRFQKDEPPRVESSGDSITITVKDHVLNRDVMINADILALSAAIKAADTEKLANTLKLPRNDEGFFIEAHVKLRPVDMAGDGVFICGTAHSPKLITETITQAMAATSRATTFLSKDEITLSAVKATVNPEHCAACLVCVRSCPFGVPRINEDGVSEIDEALCQGCGICASECPAQTIHLNWYEDDQVMSKINALLEGELS